MQLMKGNWFPLHIKLLKPEPGLLWLIITSHRNIKKWNKWYLGWGLTLLIVIAFLILWNNSSNKNNGLIGEYFKGHNFETSLYTQVDKKINFNWFWKYPEKTNGENYSVRWEGYLKIPEEGMYGFSTISDDGVRLWVNNQNIIDNWSIHSSSYNTEEIELPRGLVPIRLEYFQAGNRADIVLKWKMKNKLKFKVIPTQYLFLRNHENF